LSTFISIDIPLNPVFPKELSIKEILIDVALRFHLCRLVAALLLLFVGGVTASVVVNVRPLI